MADEAKILLVDDHDDSLFAVASALAPLGCPLERAASGERALKTLLHGNVALVLLDVLMPDVGGLEVVRYMRRLEQTAHIPVVLMTGAAHSGAWAAEAEELGVADIVFKPVEPWILRTKVHYLYLLSQRLQTLEHQSRASF
ncbi:response regulator [Streptomyces sp. WM6378]|uniref:response regulator n=1 Tax=Streptomyces sp. WM6378 TaxID=1415557 RepID=UPI0006AEBDC8|nr:response regulator [Streptomyces sp. WM6378]